MESETNNSSDSDALGSKETTSDLNKERKPPEFSFTKLFSGLTLLLGCGVLAVFVCSLFGRNFLISELMSNFRLQIAGLMIPFAIIIYRMGVWRWLAWTLFAGALWSLATIGWIFLPAENPATGDRPIRVMSYNVLGHNWKQPEVIKLIEEVDPDVLLVLEYSQNWHERLEPLYEAYPYKVLQPRWHGFGIAFLSKHPIVNSEVLQLTKYKTDNPSIIATVDVEGQTIRFAGLHSLSPTTKYRFGLRNQQFRELANHVARKKYPTVVMGDFNCTPWSPFLKDFVEVTGYRDSRQGQGYQVSWPVAYPMLRIPIDHAFVSEEVHVHSRRIGRSVGSDHLPVILEISTAQ